jgi:hypothetical protein
LESLLSAQGGAAPAGKVNSNYTNFIKNYNNLLGSDDITVAAMALSFFRQQDTADNNLDSSFFNYLSGKGDPASDTDQGRFTSWNNLTSAQRTQYKSDVVNSFLYTLDPGFNNHNAGARNGAETALTNLAATTPQDAYWISRQYPDFLGKAQYFVSKFYTTLQGTLNRFTALVNKGQVLASDDADKKKYVASHNPKAPRSTPPTRKLKSSHDSSSAGVLQSSGGIWALQDVTAEADYHGHLSGDKHLIDEAASLLSKGRSLNYLLHTLHYSASVLNSALETLGISDRQISAYAKAAGIGGVGTSNLFGGNENWTVKGKANFEALKGAIRMRVAIMGNGQNATGYDGHNDVSNGVLSVASARDAIETGAKAAGFKDYVGVGKAMLNGENSLLLWYIGIPKRMAAMNGSQPDKAKALGMLRHTNVTWSPNPTTDKEAIALLMKTVDRLAPYSDNMTEKQGQKRKLLTQAVRNIWAATGSIQVSIKVLAAWAGAFTLANVGIQRSMIKAGLSGVTHVYALDINVMEKAINGVLSTVDKAMRTRILNSATVLLGGFVVLQAAAAVAIVLKDHVDKESKSTVVDKVLNVATALFSVAAGGYAIKTYFKTMSHDPIVAAAARQWLGTVFTVSDVFGAVKAYWNAYQAFEQGKKTKGALYATGASFLSVGAGVDAAVKFARFSQFKDRVRYVSSICVILAGVLLAIAGSLAR